MQQPVDGVTMDRMLYSSASTTGSSQGYHREMLPRTDNLDNHSFTHHDIARMFDDRTVVTGISRTLFDSVPFDEPSTNYSAAFTEPTFHSSFASIEANNLEDNSFLETFTSEALYTNNLSQKEADELSFAAIPSSEVLHYCPVLLPTLEFLEGSADLLCMVMGHEMGILKFSISFTISVLGLGSLCFRESSVWLMLCPLSTLYCFERG
jgi:hypothetical protein